MEQPDLIKHLDHVTTIRRRTLENINTLVTLQRKFISNCILAQHKALGLLEICIER